MPENTSLEGLDLVGAIEAAGNVGVKEATFRHCYKRWGIPSRKIGRLVRFSRRELAEWVEARRQAPAPTTPVAEIGPDGRKGRG